MFQALMLFIMIDKRSFCLVISLFDTVESLCIVCSQGDVFEHCEKSSEVIFRPIVNL